MAQVTDSLLAEFQARVDRGEHINSTVNEEAQLLHAFRERQSLQKSLDMLYGVKFSDRCYHALKSRAERGEEYAVRTRELLREVFTRFAPKETASGGLCGWCSTYKMRHLDGCVIPRIDAALAASPKDQGGSNETREVTLTTAHPAGSATLPTPTIPEGYALVPKEPTGPMWVAGELEARAGRYETDRSLAGSIWRAMLAAAPAAPVSVSGERSGWIKPEDRFPLAGMTVALVIRIDGGYDFRTGFMDEGGEWYAHPAEKLEADEMCCWMVLEHPSQAFLEPAFASGGRSGGADRG